MKSYRNPKTAVGPSRIHGRGAYTTAPITRGEIVAVRGGSVVRYDEALRRDATLGGFSMQVDEGLFLCPDILQDVEDVAVFINHSCDPNVGIRGQISFVALRDINVDEELTFDYAMNTSIPYVFDCACGSQQCRGKVTGSDWLNPILQERYAGYFDFVISSRIESGLPPIRPSASPSVQVAADGPTADRIVSALGGLETFEAWRTGVVGRQTYGAELDSVMRLPATIPLNENERALSSRLHWRPGEFVESALARLHAAGGIADTYYDWRRFNYWWDLIKSHWRHEGYKTFIFPEEAQLLYAISDIRNPRRVAVVGSYYGYWAAFLCAALADADSRVVLLDNNAAACELAESNLRRIGLSGGVEVVATDAMDYMDQGDPELFDLVVLDAEGPLTGGEARLRRKAIYGPMSEAIGRRLTQPHACLVAHNILLETDTRHQYLDDLCKQNNDELGEFLLRMEDMLPNRLHLPTTEGVGVYWV